MIQYPATQRTLAQATSTLFAEGNSVAIEFGIVKCYANGVYKYDRSYVKAGKTIDSMELMVWYDNTERGAYGTGVVSRGTDIEGVDFTLRSTMKLHTVTDVSKKVEEEVYYPAYVTDGESATITLYAKEGMRLGSLEIGGVKVQPDRTEDGAYVYTIPRVTKDIKFTYTMIEDENE